MTRNWAPTSKRRWATALLAAAVCGVGGITARAVDFFDWQGEVQNPLTSPYVTAPTLSDATAASVNAFLLSQEAAGVPLAVKIRSGVTLSPATIATIFNGHNVKYIFADYEGPNALAQTTALVTAVKASTNTGPQIAAGNSFIGNYALAPIPNDPTHPAGSSSVSGNSPTNPYFTITDFRNSGASMANEQLYPGDSSFRNPINGNSTAPNIRSALFTLPIQRLSIVSQNIGTGQLNIPYVSRFNNFTNPAFQNTTTTIPNPQGGFIKGYDTSIGAANAGQLLSRNDFQALLLHYRMRGASTYQILDPGVQGYSMADAEADALAGWRFAAVASVLQGTNGRVATLPTTITVNGTVKSIEDAGAVWSAVTNDSGELAVLVSNLDSASKTVSFNTRINGATLSFTSTALAGGTHTLLKFTKSGGIWAASSSTPVFNDPNLASRDGVGIPEPASLSLLGIGAFGILARRRRRSNA